MSIRKAARPATTTCSVVGSTDELSYDDVFTRIDKCRAHYATNGLGVDYIDQFIR